MHTLHGGLFVLEKQDNDSGEYYALCAMCGYRTRHVPYGNKQRKEWHKNAKRF